MRSRSVVLILSLGLPLAGCHGGTEDASSEDGGLADGTPSAEGAASDAACSCGIPVASIPGMEATCLACINSKCAGAAAGCQSVCCPATDDTCENGGRAPYAACVSMECPTECASCLPEPAGTCAGNATGYTCAPGDTPDSGAGAGPATIACTIPVSGEGGAVDVCCIPWTYPAGQCIPLPRPLPSCAPGSYTFNCGANDDPTLLDPSLSCAAPVPDVDGTVDYCCTGS